LAKDRRADGGGERSEEERERARQERERRRLERAGAPPHPPTAPPLPPPPEPALEPTQVEEEEVVCEPIAAEPQYPISPARHPETVDSTPDPIAPAEFAPEDEPAAAALSPLRTPTHYVHSHHLHRPHLHRPHVPRPHSFAARVGALLVLILVLGGLAVAAVLLLHRKTTPKPAPPIAIVKLTIPEGFTRSQIAALAHADGLKGSYLLASKRSSELDLARYGAPAGTPNLEGFLFPATYELYAGTPASRLVSEQLAAFRENFGGTLRGTSGEVHRAKVLGVTPYELLIVASIIEREVAIPHDRPLVAAVIYNRLRLHMTLGVDSTLRYALHDFSHPLTESQLASKSPYNTRIHRGLPPTPISNPGAAAIAAAAHPAKVSYLYYVSGADGCGEQVFSTSYAEFERNAAAYREAVQKNGGRVPTCHKK
jgi:cell division protein YceG involved in septum cleavage